VAGPFLGTFGVYTRCATTKGPSVLSSVYLKADYQCVQTKKLTSGQTARRLGISTQRIHQLAATGQLAFEETPLGRLFLLDDVDRYQRLRQVRLRRRAKPTKASGPPAG
jgi:hypothetical protein